MFFFFYFTFFFYFSNSFTLFKYPCMHRIHLNFIIHFVYIRLTEMGAVDTKQNISVSSLLFIYSLPARHFYTEMCLIQITFFYVIEEKFKNEQKTIFPFFRLNLIIFPCKRMNTNLQPRRIMHTK